MGATTSSSSRPRSVDASLRAVPEPLSAGVVVAEGLQLCCGQLLWGGVEEEKAGENSKLNAGRARASDIARSDTEPFQVPRLLACSQGE